MRSSLSPSVCGKEKLEVGMPLSAWAHEAVSHVFQQVAAWGRYCRANGPGGHAAHQGALARSQESTLLRKPPFLISRCHTPLKGGQSRSYQGCPLDSRSFTRLLDMGCFRANPRMHVSLRTSKSQGSLLPGLQAPLQRTRRNAPTRGTPSPRCWDVPLA